jgi:hypothetical protein
MDRAACEKWLAKYFHPDGLKCPHCQADVEQAIWTPKAEIDEMFQNAGKKGE